MNDLVKVRLRVVLFSIEERIFDLLTCIFDGGFDFFLRGFAVDFGFCIVYDLIKLVFKIFFDIVGKFGSIDLVLRVLHDFVKVRLCIVLFGIEDRIFDLFLCILDRLTDVIKVGRTVNFVLCTINDLIDLVLEIFFDVVGEVGGADLIFRVLHDLVKVRLRVVLFGIEDRIFDLFLCILDRLTDVIKVGRTVNFVLCTINDLIDLVLEIFFDVVGEVGGIDLIFHILRDVVKIGLGVFPIVFKSFLVTHPAGGTIPIHKAVTERFH